jgi:hypothetical protein
VNTEPAPRPPTACLNCGEPLLPRANALPPRFCPACGQETNVKPPTLGEFAQQFGGAYFATEGALWRTLKLLLLKPGELTRLYLAGRRKHFVLPLRLYLTISVLVLLLLRVMGGGGSIKVDVGPDKADSPTKASLNLNMLGGRAGLREGVFFCENLPAWMCRRLKSRIDFAPTEMQGAIETLRDRFVGNLGGATFVLLPAFALWMKLVYRSRRMRYTEHLVFALHVHAFWFIALALTLPDIGWLSVAALVVVPLYTLLSMRRVFGGRWWPRLLRAAVVALLYGVTMAFALAGVGLVALFG